MSFFDDDAEVTQVTRPPRARAANATVRGCASSAWSSPSSPSSSWSSCWPSSFARASRTPKSRPTARTSPRSQQVAERRRQQGGQADRGAAGRPHASTAAPSSRASSTPWSPRRTRSPRAPSASARPASSRPAPDPGAGPAGAPGRRQQVRAGLLAALTGKNLHATARKLAALSGYFTGPDVYYNELYRTPGAEGHDRRRRQQRGRARVELLLQQPRVLADRPERRAVDRVVVDQAHRRARRRPRRRGRQEQRQHDHADGGRLHTHFTASVGVLVLGHRAEPGQRHRETTCRSRSPGPGPPAPRRQIFTAAIPSIAPRHQGDRHVPGLQHPRPRRSPSRRPSKSKPAPCPAKRC